MLNGVFMHKRPNKLKFLTEKNDKVFFASVQGQSNSQGNRSSFLMLENSTFPKFMENFSLFHDAEQPGDESFQLTFHYTIKRPSF